MKQLSMLTPTQHGSKPKYMPKKKIQRKEETFKIKIQQKVPYLTTNFFVRYFADG